MSLSWLCTAVAGAAIGDRLVVSINSTPYSQRHIETFLLTRECLRENVAFTENVLSEATWKQALASFIDDALIHQEAYRVGSFQAGDSAIKIAREKFEKCRAQAPAATAAATRLGLDERSLVRTLHTVLRIEAFKRNKEKQSIVSRADDEGAPKWFEEIKERGVVRIFTGGEQYVPAQAVVTPAK